MKLSVNNNWVGYLDRSYEQIKSSVLSRLVTNNPEITDHNESNLFIIMISMFSGITEMINYYIDNMAREGFLPVARKFDSIIKIVGLIDYRPKAMSAATVDLIFTLLDNTGNRVSATNSVFFPDRTVINSIGAIQFRTIGDTYLLAGASSLLLKAENANDVPEYNFATGTGSPNQLYPLPSNYVHASIHLKVDGVLWSEYTSFAKMKSTTKAFIVYIDEDKNVSVLFGDGIHGAKPGNGLLITAYYKTTDGTSGNLSPSTINVFLIGPVLVQPNVVAAITNPDYSAGGTDIEGAEEVRTNAPLSLRTLDRAVTYQDYIDIALLVSGVGQAKVFYQCGKFVDIYILPKTRGNSSLALNDRVYNQFYCKKMVTTQVDVLSAGVSRVWLEMTIFGKPLFTDTQIRIDAINALDDNFGYDAQTINNTIKLSDVVSVIRALEKVDDINIDKMQVEPYVRIFNGTRPLDITFLALPLSTITINYKIKYVFSELKFAIYKNGIFQTFINPGDDYADAIVSFHVEDTFGSVDNDAWVFTITPSYPEIFPNSSINIVDFSMGIIDVGPLINSTTPRTIFSNINIETTSIQTNCLGQ